MSNVQEPRVLTAADIPGLATRYPCTLVEVPEWGGAVWVWAVTVHDMYEAIDDLNHAEAGAKTGQMALLTQVIASVRDSGELQADGSLPAHVFSRYAHMDWLTKQPFDVLDRIRTAGNALDRTGGAAQAKEADFFAALAQVARCLKSIGTVPAFCTGCPTNSPETCPLAVYGEPSQPNAS